MDWNLIHHVRSVIRAMERNDEIYTSIMSVPKTYEGVKTQWALQGLRGWWYLVWNTARGKVIFIFLDMVQNENNWVKIEEYSRRFDWQNCNIWEDYFGNAVAWTSQNPAQEPTAANATTDNLGPWPKPGDTDT